MYWSRRAVMIGALLTLASSNDAHSEGWSHAFALPGCWDGSVRAFYLWDDVLVAVGAWREIGGGGATSDAAWFDGADWQGYGEDEEFEASLDAVTEYAGDLVVGGWFINRGGASLSRVARWNGTTWSGVAGSSGPSARVRSLIVHDGMLYAGGEFTHADGALVNGVARWNGVGWESVGTGLPEGQVDVLFVYDGQLLAGGEFVSPDGMTPSYFAMWNGFVWSPFMGGADGPVYTCLLSRDSLWVGGEFTTAGGVETGPVAIWDGVTWSGTEPGLFGGAGSLTEYRGDVHATLSVTDPQARLRRGIYRWSEDQWEEVADSYADQVFAWGDELLLANNEHTIVNGAPARGMARYDGTQVTGFCPGYGVGGPGFNVVNDFAVVNEKLLVFGLFEVAGCARSRGVALWENGAWSPLLSGVESTARTAVEYGDDLIIGGSFSHASGVLANNVARWDGSNWHPLGEGLGGAVCWLACYRSDLYAAGWFEEYIARWDGAEWVPVGGGLEATTQFPNLQLHVWNDLLLVAGDFGVAGGAPAKELAAWDGESWQELGGGFPGGGVTRITTYKGDLLVSGVFTSAGGTGIDRLARWNGSSWIDEGAELPQGAVVARVAPVGDVLYANGGGGTLGRGAIRRVGSVWETLADQPLYSFYTCVQFESGVYFGGDFMETTPNLLSSRLARWDLDPPTPIDPITPDAPPGFQGTLLVLPPHPNPSGHGTRATFAIDEAGTVEVRVFSATGRLVRDLTVADTYSPGTHSVEWDGRADAGHAAADGVYFLSVSAGGRTETYKVVIAR